MDLRQLGNVLYTRKKKKTATLCGLEMSNGHDLDGDVDVGKRVSKQRVVMVDGKGTGYGGAVPVLAETMVTHCLLVYQYALLTQQIKTYC